MLNEQSREHGGFQTMIGRTILTVAVLALALPLEPDVRVEMPTAYSLVDHIRTEILENLNQVRADLKANEASKR